MRGVANQGTEEKFKIYVLSFRNINMDLYQISETGGSGKLGIEVYYRILQEHNIR